jgi:8-oxo-dGTP pyrophosphatase MutT (NUDIX family)
MCQRRTTTTTRQRRGLTASSLPSPQPSGTPRLLIERTDNGLWALPGGAQDIGESVAQAARREVREETGIDVEITGLSGIYSDPRHVIAYGDGEVRQEFSLCFHAKPVGGQPRSSSESSQARWVSPDSLQDLNIHPSMRLRINHALKQEPQPYLG